MSIEIINESDFVPIKEEEFLGLAYFVYEKMQVDRLADLTIVFMNEPEIAKLHKDWMNLDGPTDVMSFPIDELTPGALPNRLHSAQPNTEDYPAELLNLCLGDIVICPTVAAKQATESGHTTQEEMLLLATHGILHLLGYDHATADEKATMFDLQRKLLIGYIATSTKIPEDLVQIKGLPE